MDWLYLTFWENTLLQWLISLGITIILLALSWLARWAVLRRFSETAAQNDTFWDDALVAIARTTRLPIVLLPSLYIASQSLVITPNLLTWFKPLAIIALTLQAAIWGGAVIRDWSDYYRRRNIETNAGGVGTTELLAFVLRIALYSILLLLALDNIPGVQITTLVASLGIGGIAIALAVQNILADLFASLSVALDKPFVIGDFIIVGEMMGTVERIGLKTTRVRSLSGEQLIFSNNDLLTSRIRNYKRMQERRVLFNFGVAYETTPDQLRQIPKIVRTAIEAQENTRFDRAHLLSFDAYALRYEVVYFVLSPDYNLYMDIQQEINLYVFEQLAAAGIVFARPAQVNYPAESVLQLNPVYRSNRYQEDRRR